MANGDSNEDSVIEAEIIRTLKSIGFPQTREEWRDAPAVLDVNEETLTMLGHPVMQAWERPYMQKLAEISTSKAQGQRVLEVGFGLGISAGYIQQNSPGEHVIIEMNREIAQSARGFASRSVAKVTVLEGFWQDIVPELESGSFMGILFDTYVLTEEEVDVIFHPFLEHAFRLLVTGGVLTYYSDEATWFSDTHLASLQNAGFRNINGVLCNIDPPKNCQYWRQSTMLAPIIERHAE